jgi:hypothetical protein
VDVPISGKVVSVGGFTVDADGKILGPGHTGRDVLPKKLYEGQVGWGAFGRVAKAT